MAITATGAKVCIVCEDAKETGIYLYNGFICEECERSMIETDTSDPKYQFYLKQLRKIQLPVQTQ
ncbi:sigma factor G inhibitor Gin [Ectobacillus ponti]|uniref:Sigma factor G inhibitor Gin n=1 Tax=Ectobacillus ponti TaxID=2961894 RepID=A0AA41X961_9BACI|nr:sigma factor G inhibitor Gin [Ectobacillus ponti]MCP8971204.1 sigma factor G inhibitor Gin [Ectobacillus ponti]